MRFYKIEFYCGQRVAIEDRIRVVERQYTSGNRARAAAYAMFVSMDKHGVECGCYTVTPV